MRVVTGDATGLTKVVQLEGGKVLAKMGTQEKNRVVDRLCWSGAVETEESHFCQGLSNGFVEEWDASTFTLSHKRKVYKEGPFCAMQALRAGSGIQLFTCSREGEVHFNQWRDQNGFFVESDEAAEAWGNVGKNMYIARADEAGSVFACGGKDHDMKIWDVESKQTVFAAKNLKNDNVNLKIPVWVTDLHFGAAGTHQVVVSTGYGQVRMYDTRTQRRPILNVEKITEHPILTMSRTHDDNMVMVADSVGTMRQVDLRKGLALGAFKGTGGSIRGLAMHSSLKYAASVGLDRFMRVYDVSSRKAVFKVYLKQKLTAVLFSTEMQITKPAGDAENVIPTDAKADDEEWLDELAGEAAADEDNEGAAPLETTAKHAKRKGPAKSAGAGGKKRKA